MGGGIEISPELKTVLGVKDLLWETTLNPTSPFNSQTISLDLSNYSEITIDYLTYRGGYASGVKSLSLTVPHVATYMNNCLDMLYIRSVEVTTNGVIFGPGKSSPKYNDWSSTWTNDNNSMIPVRIWGYNPPHL